MLPGHEDPRIQASQASSVRLARFYTTLQDTALNLFYAPLQRATEIYGPSGLREFLRVNLRLTQSILTRPYVVHELLFDSEEACVGVLHPSERQGDDIRAVNGTWEKFATVAGVEISAGPILHTGMTEDSR